MTVVKFDWGKFKRERVDALFYDFKRWLEENVHNAAKSTGLMEKTNYDEESMASCRTKAAGRYNYPHTPQNITPQIS